MRGAQGKLCDLVGVRRRHPQVFAFLSAPVDTPTLSLLSPIPCSLESNDIGPEGASTLAAVLKETMVSSLKCAAAPSVRFRVSAH